MHLADTAKPLKLGKDIMQSFLIDKSRVEIIVLSSKRIDHNSTCTGTAALENKTKNRRITMNIGSTSVVFPIVAPCKQRATRGSRENRKKAVKIIKKKYLKFR